MKIVLIICVALLLWCFNADASTAFYKHEYIDGQNKICVYEHFSGDVAITIRAWQVCPVTIEVPDW